MGWLTKYLGEAIFAAVGLLANYLFSLAYVFCLLLNVNRGFCEEFSIKYGFAIGVGFIIGVAWARKWRLLLSIAVVLLIAPWIVAKIVGSSNWPSWVYELLLLAPMQAGAGLAIGVGAVFLWKKLEPRILKHLDAAMKKIVGR